MWWYLTINQNRNDDDYCCDKEGGGVITGFGYNEWGSNGAVGVCTYYGWLKYKLKEKQNNNKQLKDEEEAFLFWEIHECDHDNLMLHKLI